VKARAQSGFSALEALIAAAILAVALVPILDMRRQSLREEAHYEAVRARISAQRSAIAVLTSVNPMAEPVGARGLSDDTTLRWRARPLTRPIRSTAHLSADGDFDVALYEVTATVNRNDASIASFSIELIGWRKRPA